MRNKVYIDVKKGLDTLKSVKPIYLAVKDGHIIINTKIDSLRLDINIGPTYYD